MLNWIVWKRTDYLYKIDLALTNQQKLICHKTQTTNFRTLPQKWSLEEKFYRINGVITV